MFQIRLLILLCFNGLLLLSCSIVNNSYLTDSQRNEIYIAVIDDYIGMLLRNELQQYFPNNDQAKTKYTLEADISTNESGYLNNRYGFANRNHFNIIVKIKLVNNANQEVVLQDSYNIKTSYPIVRSGFVNQTNKQQAYQQILNTLSDNIYNDMVRFKLTDNNLNNSISNENTASQDSSIHQATAK